MSILVFVSEITAFTLALSALADAPLVTGVIPEVGEPT